ncbi:MAG: 5-methylcytosine restriction system specificity protein McrC [Syntrophobacteraceae bacterium]
MHRREPDEPALRGRLDPRRQLNENELERRHKIDCAYENLTMDNPTNRGIL